MPGVLREMRKIRVLVVDDSAVIRQLLTDVLQQEPCIEVVGTAVNGRIALTKLAQLNPDLVTLDVEMPEMDGLETLTAIRKTHPKLPVIMFSTLTDRGAVATIEALSRGASSYVSKPSNTGSFPASVQNVKEQLIPKIKALCPIEQPGQNREGTAAVASFAKPVRMASCRPDLVAIGCSTGGPQALEVVLKHLPPEFPVPIVVVQHMPAMFTKYLAARLDQECALSVSEASQGAMLQPGKVLIAPGDYHLELGRDGASMVASLQQQPPENSCRPSVDVLFRSVAKLYGPRCLAVVLTGMGQDGLRGAEKIVEAKGTIIVQDQASSVVWGMPRVIAEAGLASAIVPLREISLDLQRRAGMSRQLAAAGTSA